MTSASEILFNSNDNALDRRLMAAKFEFFQEKKEFKDGAADAFAAYETLSVATKKVFREHFIYDLTAKLTISDTEFLELLQFLNFTCIDHHKIYYNKLPLFRRFLHANRANKPLMRATILIHMNPHYVIGHWSDDGRDTVNMMCIALKIDTALSWKEKYEIFADATSSWHRHMHAFCVHHGVGVSRDAGLATTLFKSNWLDNAHEHSLVFYCSNICNDEELRGDFASRKLLQIAWTEHRNTFALKVLCEYLIDGNDGPVEARKAQHLRWTAGWVQNKTYIMLDQFIDVLEGEEESSEFIIKLRQLHNNLIKEH